MFLLFLSLTLNLSISKICDDKVINIGNARHFFNINHTQGIGLVKFNNAFKNKVKSMGLGLTFKGFHLFYLFQDYLIAHCKASDYEKIIINNFLTDENIYEDKLITIKKLREYLH